MQWGQAENFKSKCSIQKIRSCLDGGYTITHHSSLKSHNSNSDSITQTQLPCFHNSNSASITHISISIFSLTQIKTCFVFYFVFYNSKFCTKWWDQFTMLSQNGPFSIHFFFSQASSISCLSSTLERWQEVETQNHS